MDERGGYADGKRVQHVVDPVADIQACTATFRRISRHEPDAHGNFRVRIVQSNVSVHQWFDQQGLSTPTWTFDGEMPGTNDPRALRETTSPVTLRPHSKRIRSQALRESFATHLAASWSTPRRLLHKAWAITPDKSTANAVPAKPTRAGAKIGRRFFILVRDAAGQALA